MVYIICFYILLVCLLLFCSNLTSTTEIFIEHFIYIKQRYLRLNDDCLPNGMPNNSDLITKWDNSKLGLSYRESWCILNSLIPKILTQTLWFYQGLSSLARSELQFLSLILISIPSTTFNLTFQPLLLKSTITPQGEKQHWMPWSPLRDSLLS